MTKTEAAEQPADTVVVHYHLHIGQPGAEPPGAEEPPMAVATKRYNVTWWLAVRLRELDDNADALAVHGWMRQWRDAIDEHEPITVGPIGGAVLHAVPAPDCYCDHAGA